MAANPVRPHQRIPGIPVFSLSLYLLFLVGGPRPAGAADLWFLEKRPEGTRIPLPASSSMLGLKIPASFLGLAVVRQGESLILLGPEGRTVMASPRLGMAESGGRYFPVQGSPAGAWNLSSLARLLGAATGLPVTIHSEDKLIVVGEGGAPSGGGDEGSGYRVRRVVLDAGHGGRDPGAAGPSRYPEKDITLDIIQRLAQTLKEKAPDLDIILTRDRDTYVELKERTKIANSKNADLFLSVHCNARKRNAPSGSEVYIYNPRVDISEQGEQVAKENEGMTDMILAQTLADLGNQAWRERSLNLGILVLEGLQKRLLLKPRFVREANYYVLGFVNMPSVLVEVAYLNNAGDEKRLKSGNFRQTVAEVLAEAILKYRDLQTPSTRN